ncbi:BnaCnng23330D [Brassica napus]|uniref:BnaCnng23330D protein n=1 Tax=Brassica napus TaxID=3708 RepID=A0A078IUV1_BRANA|nr:BnaCnng23330D [Brassica napus]
MSREDYLATAMLRSSDSKAGVSPSVRRQTSHNVYYVQVVQLLSERRYQTTNSSPSCPVRLESHKPPRVAPILQTGVRSRSFTGTDPKFFGILSFPTCRKVMLFSLPSILLDGGSLPLRRSSTGDLFHGADEWPKSFVIRPMLTALIELPEGLPGSVLIRSFSSFEEKLLPPYLLSIERGVPSVSLLSVCFSFFIVLLSCVAVSTGPEDANEITLIFLVDEVWTLTSHYVTTLPLFDFVVKVPSTHSSTVLNSLSSSIEDLSCLVYLCVVCYVYGQRGWIIPSIYCSDEV